MVQSEVAREELIGTTFSMSSELQPMPVAASLGPSARCCPHVDALLSRPVDGCFFYVKEKRL
jgi:hypothetical protein